MDLESQAFAEARDALRAAGLLDLQRLAATPGASLPEIARLAVQGEETALTKEDMLATTKQKNKNIYQEIDRRLEQHTSAARRGDRSAARRGDTSAASREN